MKQIVTAVLVIFAIAACIKSPESNDELSSASDPVLISHMDSICFFHNRVMDNIKLMTRSGELSVNPPIHIFVDRVSDCTEDVLLSNDINYRVTTDQKNKMTESVSPFIFGLLDSNNDSMKQINNIIDSSFSKSCAQCLKQLIETDFLIQPDISQSQMHGQLPWIIMTRQNRSNGLTVIKYEPNQKVLLSCHPVHSHHDSGLWIDNGIIIPIQHA